MIPKYIHYCWFGKRKMPDKFKKYIDSWKKFFPDYNIIEWNESNFPFSDYLYAAQALERKKYAFVSDVARVYALEKMGGIYFDTDVEVIRSFEDILKDKSVVLGTETVKEFTIGTGFMAFPAGHKILKILLGYYRDKKFVLDNGQEDIKGNTRLLAELLDREYGIRPSDDIQIKYDVVVYPQDYFTAYDGERGVNVLTENTYCVHHFAASWFSPYQKMKIKLKLKLKMICKNIFLTIKKTVFCLLI